MWGRSIPEIILSINGRRVHLHYFTPSQVMLGYVPEWKVTRGETQEFTPGITPRTRQEATLGEVEELEDGPGGLIVERIFDRREEQ